MHPAWTAGLPCSRTFLPPGVSVVTTSFSCYNTRGFPLQAFFGLMYDMFWLFNQASPDNGREAEGALETARANSGGGGGGGGDGEKGDGNGIKSKLGKAFGKRGGGNGGSPPGAGTIGEEQEAGLDDEGDQLLKGGSDGESRSAEDRACREAPAPPPATKPRGAPSASSRAAAAVTGTAGSPGPAGRGGAGEAKATTTLRRSTRQRRSTSKAAGSGEGSP